MEGFKPNSGRVERILPVLLFHTALAIHLAGFAMSVATAAAPLIVAHRGASHDAPENTLAAFRLAWSQGADAIEGDFHLTKDGRIVCLHDATTKRTAGKDLKVAESTLDQLRGLEVGSWKGAQWAGERLPTLEDTLATVPPGKRIFIELKCGPEIVAPLKEVLSRSPLAAGQTILIAFDQKVVAEARRQMPDRRVHWLTGYQRDTALGRWTPSPADILDTLKRCGADGLGSEAHASVNESLATALRQAGYTLHVWTVDQPAEAGRLCKLGVDSITTNRPQWLRARIRRWLTETPEQVQRPPPKR